MDVQFNDPFHRYWEIFSYHSLNAPVRHNEHYPGSRRVVGACLTFSSGERVFRAEREGSLSLSRTEMSLTPLR